MESSAHLTSSHCAVIESEHSVASCSCRKRAATIAGLGVLLITLCALLLALLLWMTYLHLQLSALETELSKDKTAKTPTTDVNHWSGISSWRQSAGLSTKRVRRPRDTAASPRYKRFALINSNKNPDLDSSDFHVINIDDTIIHKEYLQWKLIDDNETEDLKTPGSYNLSTPVITEDGLYLVYTQVTWSGKVQKPRPNKTKLANKAPSFTVQLLPKLGSSGAVKDLLTSVVTQAELGYALDIDVDQGLHSDYYPHDSAHSSGVFQLQAGQVLAVNVKTADSDIVSGKDATFFGFTKLNC